MVASTDLAPNLDGHLAYRERVDYERGLLVKSSQRDAPAWVRQAILAADQFRVSHPLPDDSQGCAVIAGYLWFGDWGRDTMISLPGLTTVAGRNEIAERILRTYARFEDRGMLPNQFPEADGVPEYNTVDATLWYFEAMRVYCAENGGDGLLRDLFPVLQEIVDWRLRGTRHDIHVDPADGLLYAGDPGVQLTWMDAKVSDWVATPRVGKPVEVNALWYNALRSTALFANRLGRPARDYEALARQVQTGFARFWNEATGYCYDVIDGPNGRDASLRPNQLLAMSLTHSLFTHDRQRSIVDACARHLLTPHGLRKSSTADAALHEPVTS